MLGWLAAATALALLPATVMLHGEAFPADPARRAALRRCADSEPGFDRWHAAARAACYERRLDSPAAVPPGRRAPIRHAEHRAQAA